MTREFLQALGVRIFEVEDLAEGALFAEDYAALFIDRDMTPAEHDYVIDDILRSVALDRQPGQTPT